MLGVQDLSEELKSLIDRYLEGHRNRSLATLSRASGVSYTTIRRFAQREGHPTAEPVLKIVDATLSAAEKIEFLRRHFPEIARTIHKIDAGTYAAVNTALDHVKMFYGRDPHNFILNIAITAAGTTVSDVERLCGERGLVALDEMIDFDVLERDHATGAIRAKDDTLFIVDCETAFRNIEKSIQYFDRSMIGTKAAKLGHMTASLSEEGVEKIHTIVSDAISEIFAVKDDPRFAGEIPLFVDLLMNTYDRSKYRSSKPKGERSDA